MKIDLKSLRPVALADRTLFESKLAEQPSQSCECSFANLFMYQQPYGIDFVEADGRLIVYEHASRTIHYPIGRWTPPEELRAVSDAFVAAGLTDGGIYDVPEEFLDREGMAPTVYEIAAHFDIKTSTVFAHLRALQRKKQLSRSSKARSISLINRPNSRNKVPQGALLIPLLGRVNAGAPAESLEYKEGEVCISSTLAPDCPPENLFALRVQGESMRDLGIYEGDIVIVAQTAVKPRSGDIVVALLQGGEVTVKSFFPKTQGRIELRPANPEYNVQIYPASEVSIQGRVIELRRKY